MSMKKCTLTPVLPVLLAIIAAGDTRSDGAAGVKNVGKPQSLTPFVASPFSEVKLNRSSGQFVGAAARFGRLGVRAIREDLHRDW